MRVSAKGVDNSKETSMVTKFTTTLKNGLTVTITATVHDGMVDDFSMTARVVKNGVSREVLVAERGSPFDADVRRLVLSRVPAAVIADEGEDDSEDWTEAESA